MATGTRTRRRGIIACGLLGALLLAGCELVPCETTRLQAIPSPDDRIVATAYMIDCGAVGEWNLHVQLRTAGEEFSKNGSGEVLALRGAFEAKLTWIDRGRLSIDVSCLGESECDAQHRAAFNTPIVMKNSWQQIAIRYTLHEHAAPAAPAGAARP